MKTKFAYVFLFVVLCTALCTVCVSAGIGVSQPKFYLVGAIDKEIYELEAGIVKGQLTVSNMTDSLQSVTLILALYDKNSGLMKDIQAENVTASVGSTPISTSISVDAANVTDGVLRAFVWSNVTEVSVSISSQYGLYDVAPAPEVPYNIRKLDATYRTITLTWDEPWSNLGIASYEVYRNGDLIGTSSTTTFKDDGERLDYGTAYAYAIRAIDVSGKASTLSAKTSLATNDAAWVLFGVNNETNLLDKPVPWSADLSQEMYSEAVEAGPPNDLRWCRRITSFAQLQRGHLYVAIDKSFIGPDDRVVTIKLTYLDEGAPTIAIDYLSTTDRFKSTIHNKTNTDGWVTTEFVLTDAEFNGPNRQVGNQYDFRIRSTGLDLNTVNHVYKVEIFKGLDE